MMLNQVKTFLESCFGHIVSLVCKSDILVCSMDVCKDPEFLESMILKVQTAMRSTLITGEH